MQAEVRDFVHSNWKDVVLLCLISVLYVSLLKLIIKSVAASTVKNKNMPKLMLFVLMCV